LIGPAFRGFHAGNAHFCQDFYIFFPGKFSESNRFKGESQKLCGDIFMAGVAVLVYSIQLVTSRQATFVSADSEFAAQAVCLPFSTLEIRFSPLWGYLAKKNLVSCDRAVQNGKV